MRSYRLNQQGKQLVAVKDSTCRVYAGNVETRSADVALSRPGVTQGKFSILLIDDDRGVLGLLSDGLTMCGHQLCVAHNGFVGLEQFHTFQPDLILLDITMPELDGIAVLKEIRRYDANVGIIMFSALSPKKFALTALREGADSYLSKPLRLQHVLAEIQKVGTVVRRRQYNGIGVS